jgi:hypothetical protein
MMKKKYVSFDSLFVDTPFYHLILSLAEWNFRERTRIKVYKVYEKGLQSRSATASLFPFGRGQETGMSIGKIKRQQ